MAGPYIADAIPTIHTEDARLRADGAIINMYDIYSNFLLHREEQEIVERRGRRHSYGFPAISPRDGRRSQWAHIPMSRLTNAWEMII